MIGYQVSYGPQAILCFSITDRRQDTIVANWFNDVFEEVTNSPEFLAWQKEVVRLFVNVIRAEFKELTRSTWRANFVSWLSVRESHIFRTKRFTNTRRAFARSIKRGWK